MQTITINDFSDIQDIANDISIKGKSSKYYVLNQELTTNQLKYTVERFFEIYVDYDFKQKRLKAKTYNHGQHGKIYENIDALLFMGLEKEF